MLYSVMMLLSPIPEWPSKEPSYLMIWVLLLVLVYPNHSFLTLAVLSLQRGSWFHMGQSIFLPYQSSVSSITTILMACLPFTINRVSRGFLSSVGLVGGYRTLAKLSHHSSPTVRRRKAMWTRLSLPLEWWLGRGKPLNPYLKGYLVEYLRKECRPGELRLAPEEFFELPGMRD